MNSGILSKSFKVFLQNFKVALVFGLLLLFVFFFSFFSEFDFSSGSVFFLYSPSLSLNILFDVILMIVFLFFYSFFVSLMVFAVRKDLSNVRVAYYLKEVITKLSIKLFVFNLLLSAFLLLISNLFIVFGLPFDLLALLLFFITISLLFVSQAIVVDEKSITESIAENFDFIKNNFNSFLQVSVLALFLVALIPLIEFIIDLSFPGIFIGRFVSLLFSLIFVLPFIETVKTYAYMLKFDLIRKSELV